MAVWPTMPASANNRTPKWIEKKKRGATLTIFTILFLFGFMFYPLSICLSNVICLCQFAFCTCFDLQRSCIVSFVHLLYLYPQILFQSCSFVLFILPGRTLALLFTFYNFDTVIVESLPFHVHYSSDPA